MGGEEGLCRRNRSMGGVLEREEGVRRSVEGGGESKGGALGRAVRKDFWRGKRKKGEKLEKEGEASEESVTGRVREKVWRGNESKGVGSGETGGKVEGDREIGGREEGRRAREG